MNDPDKHSTPVAAIVVVALVMVAYFAWIVVEMARTPRSATRAGLLFGALAVAVLAGALGRFTVRRGR